MDYEELEARMWYLEHENAKLRELCMDMYPWARWASELTRYGLDMKCVPDGWGRRMLELGIEVGG